MSKKLIKKIIQKQVWTIKKKSVVQVLTPRCRRDGEPEYGRFTIGDIERIIQLANSKVVELTPYFMDLPNIGNYVMAYSSMIDLAIYRALLWEKVDPGYATNLIGDINWQFVINTGGYYRLKRKLISLKTKEPMERMGIFLGDMLKFPYSKPGYRAELYKEGKVYHMNIYSCPLYDFYKQFGNEEGPAAGKLGEQVEGFCQHVVGRDRDQGRQVDLPQDALQAHGGRTPAAAVGVAGVEQDHAALTQESR